MDRLSEDSKRSQKILTELEIRTQKLADDEYKTAVTSTSKELKKGRSFLQESLGNPSEGSYDTIWLGNLVPTET